MASEESPAVRWFKDIGREDVTSRRMRRPAPGMVKEAGGKGANLAEMARANIPVPPGFVVTTNAYFDFLNRTQLRDVIVGALNGLDTSDGDSLEKAAKAIKQAFSLVSVLADTVQAIKKMYREMGGGPVAVRSSATAEDMPEASFAGQQSTYLNIEGPDAVVEAVRDCWASLFESRAIFYRTENKIDHVSTGIAVVVQRMVQSEMSGVMFTIEPVNNDLTHLCIDAIYGLGEAIVSGQITPDAYVVDKVNNKILSQSVEPQDWQLIRNDDPKTNDKEPNQKADVPQGKQERQKLSEDQILELAEMGQRLERHYGHPQDVEWALENEEFYIVQTRPVTTTSQATHAAIKQGITGTVIVSGSGASPGIGSGRTKVLSGPEEMHRVEKGDILVAEMTTPDYVPAMRRASAIVTDRGGRTCHAAIVSREMGLPCVVGAGNATELLTGEQTVTVDGTSGHVYEGILDIQPVRIATARYKKTRTKVYVNLADPSLAKGVAATSTDGVGLLRAEFIVAHIGEHPRHLVDQGRGHEFTKGLSDGIEAFAKAFYPRPVTYRTTDFKTNEYRNLKGGEKYEVIEENPMIGFRGASRYVVDRDIFHLEVEALAKLRQKWDNLNVMLPFVRTPDELSDVKDVLKEEGVGVHKLWMMVEIPSNAIQLEDFLDVGVDGVSIGSNDLTQLVLGVDRDNSRYANVFDERNPAVLWCLERIIRIAKARGVTSSICGQAPSFYPDLTQKLVEWGITSVSVSPDMIDRTRNIIGDVEQLFGILPPQE
ncbi:MAG: phosphoenolpyruvate synthase [Chloroflexi bacterium]|nr:phosphoenolpyruvate synthase [Chloroflexota bacterium]